MPSTPPPVALRAHTPPTPLHGPQYDNYEPYSPRRSKRTTAQSNPYSSFNGERPSFHHSTPPPSTAVKKARFATQLSSPPSSPTSPRKRSPRKRTSNYSRKTSHSDSDGPPSNSLRPSTIDPITMLPTPSKTPRKRSHAAAITSTARILSFQPNHPNDIMPSPRRMKKTSHAHPRSQAGFELYEDDVRAYSNSKGGAGEEIEIYTDANARVPVLDESEDNPFVGAKKALRRRGRKREVDLDGEMEQRVRREEGVVYVFRGKKIFRPFANNGDEEDAVSDASGTPEQRRLKHQAGPSAQRPLTRSAIKPRLLFPSEEQLRERERGVDDVDEEAVTDVEMDGATTNGGNLAGSQVSNLVSPPPTHNKKKSRAGLKGTLDATPIPIFDEEEKEEGDPMSLGTEASFSSVSASVSAEGRAKGRSPFDSWARTKGGRKRAGEPVEEGVGSGKRTRGAGEGSLG